MSKEANGGEGVHGVRTAVLTLTMNMETGQLDIRGSVPTNEFAKALCTMAADEFERKIQAKRAERAVSIALPELLEGFGNQRGR